MHQVRHLLYLPTKILNIVRLDKFRIEFGSEDVNRQLAKEGLQQASNGMWIEILGCEIYIAL